MGEGCSPKVDDGFPPGMDENISPRTEMTAPPRGLIRPPPSRCQYPAGDRDDCSMTIYRGLYP